MVRTVEFCCQTSLEFFSEQLGAGPVEEAVATLKSGRAKVTAWSKVGFDGWDLVGGI